MLTGAVTPTRFESGLALRSSNWWAFYSSWPQADGALYTAACSVSLLVTILTSARKFAAERRAAQYVEVYGLGANRMRFARAIFNGWDLQVDSGSALSEAQAGIADRLRLLVDEHERSARIEARSARERNVLWARRLLGIIVSVAYTGARCSRGRLPAPPLTWGSRAPAALGVRWRAPRPRACLPPPRHELTRRRTRPRPSPPPAARRRARQRARGRASLRCSSTR